MNKCPYEMHQFELADPVVYRAKSKWYKPKKVKKLALNSQLLTVQITNKKEQIRLEHPLSFLLCGSNFDK